MNYRKILLRKTSEYTGGRWIDKIVFMLLLSGFFLNLFLLLFFYDAYFNFIEVHVSHYGHIEHPAAAIISLQIFLVTLLFGWHAVTKKAGRFKESFSAMSLFHKAFFMAALLMTISYHVFRGNPLYEEDGFFETATAILALTSSLILLTWSLKQNKRSGIAARLALSLMFFLFGMEEISWGQRIFSWETPGVLVEFNDQNELNLHNIINPYLYSVTQSWSLFLSALLIYSEELKRGICFSERLREYADIIPPPSFLLYGFLFLFLSLQCAYFGGELTEEIFSVFGFVYACNQYVTLRKAAGERISRN